jgi:hypothetical protein
MLLSQLPASCNICRLGSAGLEIKRQQCAEAQPTEAKHKKKKKKYAHTRAHKQIPENLVKSAWKTRSIERFKKSEKMLNEMAVSSGVE